MRGGPKSDDEVPKEESEARSTPAKKQNIKEKIKKKKTKNRKRPLTVIVNSEQESFPSSFFVIIKQINMNI